MISVDRVVIVGGSVAGATVADRLGRLGYEGETVVVAAERHFPPYDPPPLSKQVLSGEWTEEQARRCGHFAATFADPADLVRHLGDPAAGRTFVDEAQSGRPTAPAGLLTI